MKFLYYRPAFFALALLLLLSCRESELKRMPDTLPDIRGNITGLSKQAKEEERVVVTVMVKSGEGLDARIPEASIRVTEETLIEDGTGKKLSAEALKQGQEVDVWLGEEMMESLPVQTDAIAVRITSK